MSRPSRPKRPRKQNAPPAADARSLAQQCLEEVLLKGADVQAALDGLLRRHKPAPRDAGLTTELVYGYLRHKARYDHLAQSFMRKPGGVPPALRLMLGQCACALAELDRVPAYATVDWGVGAATKRFGSGLGKLANAVLRRCAETVASGQAGDPEFYRHSGEPEAAFLARYCSFPRWVVDVWLERYGEATTRAWLEAQLVAPPVGLRCNPLHEGFAELSERLAALPGLQQAFPPGYALANSAALPELAELEAAGVLSRQSLASLQALQELGAFGPAGGESEGWPAPVWDCCAGHGGKSCALLEGGVAPLWSSDRSLRRLKGLRRELRRLRLPAVPVFLADATRPPLSFAPRTILVDAPCSGLGVCARRPDAKWRRRPEDTAQLAALQASILDTAAELLPHEGRLCYVTCTLHPAENEDQVQALLERRPGLELLREWRTPADSGLGEFFYGALLERTAG